MVQSSSSSDSQFSLTGTRSASHTLCTLVSTDMDVTSNSLSVSGWFSTVSKAAEFVLFVRFYHFCVYHDTGGISPAFSLKSTNAFLSAVCSSTHLATVSRKITKEAGRTDLLLFARFFFHCNSAAAATQCISMTTRGL